jgi:hypothetical protein
VDLKSPFKILGLLEFQALSLDERVEYMRHLLRDIHEKMLADKELVERSKRRGGASE